MALANTDGELVACNLRFRAASGLKHLPTALGLEPPGPSGAASAEPSSVHRTGGAGGATATSMFALFLPEALQGAYAWMAKASSPKKAETQADTEFVGLAVGKDPKKPLRLALSAVRDEKGHPSIFHLALFEDHQPSPFV
jgi:hypothetical protein